MIFSTKKRTFDGRMANSEVLRAKSKGRIGLCLRQIKDYKSGKAARCNLEIKDSLIWTINYVNLLAL